jgi:hypothetical protein
MIATVHGMFEKAGKCPERRSATCRARAKRCSRKRMCQETFALSFRATGYVSRGTCNLRDTRTRTNGVIRSKRGTRVCGTSSIATRAQYCRR